MDFGLKDKTALVLGAGGGLGSAIAAKLAREGARIAAADIDLAAAEKTAAAVESEGGKALALQWDLSDLGSIDAHVAAIERQFGPVDILVNNTGGPPPTTVSGQDPTVWNQYFQSMVLSVIAITDRVLPQMRARKWGRIVTSTSSGVVAPIA
ncbi:SDR family NAD(P)-dependent oxidoreductase, partial [Rhizobium ruizarguesonis]